MVHQVKFSLKQIVTLLVLSLMLLMQNIDVGIVNIAIPSIARSFSTSALNLKLSVTSYLIGIAIFIPISGFVADKFGSRKVLLWAIGGFMLFSFLCGISTTLTQLVSSRFLQGVCGAFMTPVGRLILLKTFNKQDLVNAYVLMSMPVILGPLIAPLMGGFFLQYLDWRYIFFINLPLGVFGFIATYCSIENYTQVTEKFNWLAFIFLGVFLAAISLFFDILFYPLVTADKIYLLLFALLMLGLYLFFELPSVNRIVNYDLFNIDTFRISFYSSWLTKGVAGGRGFILPLFLQLGLGISAFNTGYFLSCLTIGLLFGRIAIKRMLPYLGFKRMLTVANIGGSLTTLLFCFVHEINCFSIAVLVINGALTTISFMLLNILCFADVDDKAYASATSINNTVNQLSLSLGVVFLATLMSGLNYLFTPYSRLMFNLTFIAIAVVGILNQFLFKQLTPFSGQQLIKNKIS